MTPITLDVKNASKVTDLEQRNGFVAQVEYMKCADCERQVAKSLSLV